MDYRVTDTELTAVANAIRAKTKGTSPITWPNGFASEVGGLPSEIGTKAITANGTYAASSDSLDGYSEVSVAVPIPTLGTKTITENGTYSASDDSLGGYSSVQVAVSGGGGDAEYVLVEWIKSDGTQAIDTGEKLTAGSEIYVDASAIQESGKYLWLWGIQNNQSNAEYTGVQYSYDSIWVNKIQGLEIRGTGWTNKRITFSITPSVMRATPWGSSEQSSSSGTMGASTESVPVFGIMLYTNGAFGISRLIKSTLYKFSINGKDFYPVKRISDGAYGLYNTTDKTFHGDVMNGNPFTAGPEICGISRVGS